MSTQPVSVAGRRHDPRSPQGPGRVAVIGGGITGLAAAHYLARSGAEVTLFESADRVGGLGAHFDYEGDSLDRFYHVLMPTDSDLLALLEEIEHGERPYWREESLGFMYERKLYSLKTPIDLLRFRPAHFTDRIRLGLTALYAAYIAKPDPLDDMTVEEWLTRLSGKRAFERLWRPLLEAKFGDAYRRIPALWYWASFNREKGTKAEVKGYIRGGFKGIADSLVASLRRRGATVHLGSPVEWLGLDGEGRPSVRVRGETLGFDRVVITLPLTTLRELAAAGPLRVELERANTDIDYQGVLNVLVMLRRPLVPHYWIPTVQCGVPFQGIVETTRVIDPEDAGGRHLVYLMNYVHRSHPLFQRDPDQLRAEYVDALLDLFPSLGRDEIIDARVFKAPFVEPIYTPGYGKRKPPAELVPGRVYLANTAQVYPNVTSWNSSTRIARATTVALLKRVRRVG